MVSQTVEAMKELLEFMKAHVKNDDFYNGMRMRVLGDTMVRPEQATVKGAKTYLRYFPKPSATTDDMRVYGPHRIEPSLTTFTTLPGGEDNLDTLVGYRRIVAAMKWEARAIAKRRGVKFASTRMTNPRHEVLFHFKPPAKRITEPR